MRPIVSSHDQITDAQVFNRPLAIGRCKAGAIGKTDVRGSRRRGVIDESIGTIAITLSASLRSSVTNQTGEL